MPMRTTLALAGLAAAMFLSARSGYASQIVFDLLPDPSNLGNHKSVGWRFFVNESVQATAVSFFDDAGDGLSREHAVGFLDDTTEDVIFASIVSDSDPLVGFAPWREHAVDGPILLAGSYYWIVASVDSDPNPLAPKDRVTYDPLLQATIPAITFIEGGYGESPELRIPNHKEKAFFGPSFSVIIAPVAVPEPSAALLTGLAIAAVALTRRGRTS